MKRALLIGVIGIALVSMMCMGLVALGLLVSPVRAQVSRALERAFDRVEAITPRVSPRVELKDPLGQTEQQVSPEDEAGILISGVIEDSPAAEAGLRRGDILLEVDGTTVNDLSALEEALSQHEAGDQVELLVQRGDEQVTLTATLAEAQEGMPRQGHAGVLLGITICGEQASRSFGGPLETQIGLRLTQVVEGSPADEAGLKRGDVLITADGQTLDQPDALAQVLEDKQPGDSLTLEVQTGEETRDVTVTLGEHPEQEGAPYLGIRYSALRMPVMPDSDPMPWIPENPDGDNPLPPGHPPFDGLPFPPGDLASGALIQEIVEDSPAADAGLQVGQIVQSVDGKSLTTPEALVEAIAAHQPGDQVTLSVFDPQSGETSEVEVTLGENPDKAGAAWLGVRFAFLNINTEEQQLPEG